MAARDPLDDCVHCGFCLPSCPTYVSWGEEMDSPRGRIDLMKGLRAGRLALDDHVVEHFDRCLGCMACVTACPSGVRYDRLIESARATVEREHARAAGDRAFRGLVFALFPHPRRLRALVLVLLVYVASGLQWLVRKSGLLGLLPRRLRQLEALLPPLGLGHVGARLPAATAAAGEERARVGLVTGCVQGVFFPEVNRATVRVLAAEGCRVLVPPGQGCCGALSLHAGREDEARRLLGALLDRFDGRGDGGSDRRGDGDRGDLAALDAVVVNAAGCGAHLKDCAHLFATDTALAERARAFSAKVRDVNEYLAALPPRAPRHPLPLRVAYHDACHLAHAQRVRAAPRALLAAIPGLELRELPDGGECCGSAGVYNLLEPASGDEIGARKLDSLVRAEAELVASANPGCTLQLQRLLRARGITLPAAHPIELVDASLRGRPPPRR